MILKQKNVKNFFKTRGRTYKTFYGKFTVSFGSDHFEFLHQCNLQRKLDI